MIGEPLYRMADLVLVGGGENPGTLRQVGAAVVSPAAGLNRLLFGERYGKVMQRDPAIFHRLQIGGGVNDTVQDRGSSREVARRVGGMHFAMAYGLPGKPGYCYLRPFDYFDFELSAIAMNKTLFENIATRGLLFGSKYERGDRYRGVWGLYGTFDYLSPQVFRVSTTGASLGTTGQWWMTRQIALQGSGLGGLAYGAGGTIVPEADNRDYHYGATPQGLLALRLILGTRAMIDTTAREYFITDMEAGRTRGSERITRVDAGLVVRLVGCHAIGIHYLMTSRDVHAGGAGLTERHQRIGTIMLAYNLLGHPHFGAVHWGGDGTEAK